MSILLVGLIVVLALAFSASWHRRADLRHQREVVEERNQMALRGKDAARPSFISSVAWLYLIVCRPSTWGTVQSAR